MRHPQRLTRDASALAVVDMQDRILASIPKHEHVTWNVRRLLDGAQLYDIPAQGTEQYPEKLGGTVDALAERLTVLTPKRRFSAIAGFSVESWGEAGRTQIVIVGIESHVCVLQTVLDLLAENFLVHVVADAVGSRHRVDHEIALRTMENAGAMLCTTESVLFQWCDDSTDKQFKAISALVRESPPN